MYALLKCLRVNNPASEAVRVQGVQFVRDFNFEARITGPAVGEVGTAVMTIPDTPEGRATAKMLLRNPEKYAVVMTNGAHGGWYYGYGDVAAFTDHPTGDISAFDRHIASEDVDHSKGEPSLTRSNKITFFKSL